MAVVGMHPVLVGARRHFFHPRLVVEVPLHGFAQPARKRLLGTPAQFPFQLTRIDRVAAVVARAILRRTGSARCGLCGESGMSSSSRSQTMCTRSMFACWFPPPTLYVSPTFPISKTVSMARQWSATYSQSRTCCPSPYTGSGLPANALLIIKGNNFSGNCSGP